ncbi:hypothetical protein MUG91_G112n10 [Manis pentadactyla]|nr:hypothetical protein MUG91_G112n10 [Manis pentadactyla]
MLTMQGAEERELGRKICPGWVNKPASEQDVSEVDSPGIVANILKENKYQDSTFGEKYACKKNKPDATVLNDLWKMWRVREPGHQGFAFGEVEDGC